MPLAAFSSVLVHSAGSMLQIVPWIIVALLTFFLVDWYRRQAKIPDVSRKFIFLTGCDTGFGKLLARRLDALGCHVVAGCLTEAGQLELRAVCTPCVKTISLDITDLDSVRRAYEFVSRIVPAVEGLWGLVNNAAIPGVSAGPLEWHHVDDFKKVMEVNTLGLIDVTLTFLPLLKKSRGRIVNMSSTGGRLVGPLALPYDVSKTAVEAFSDGLRRHLLLYNTGITVHVIEPSIFRTEMFDPERHRRLFDFTWRRLTPAARDEFGEHFYSNYVRRSLESMNRFASREYHKVIDAYVHALTSTCPRGRYTVGYRAMFFSIPLSYLPATLVDWVVCKVHPRLRIARPAAATNSPYVLNRNVRFSAPK